MQIDCAYSLFIFFFYIVTDPKLINNNHFTDGYGMLSHINFLTQLLDFLTLLDT